MIEMFDEQLAHVADVCQMMKIPIILLEIWLILNQGLVRYKIFYKLLNQVYVLINDSEFI